MKAARGVKLAALGILAICQRSYMTLWRQPVLIVSTMLFPIVYLLILGNALNRQLRAIPLAVVDESGNVLAAEGLRVDEAAVAALEAFGEAGFLPRIGQQFHWTNAGYRDFDDYLAALTSRKRKAVKKERREALAGANETLRSVLLEGLEIPLDSVF